MVVLTLPTGLYMLGAAAAVVLTALVTALAPRLPRLGQARLSERPVLLSRTLTSTLSCLVLFALIAVGFLGSRDPLSNLLTLTIWTLLWIGLPILAMLFGDVWRPVEPWTGPVRLARRALGRTGSFGLARLGHLPAVAGLLAFAWFEIVSLAPADPLILARVVLAYWLVHFLIALLEGESWLRHGETFTVFFGLIARIAPLWTETDGDPRPAHGRPARRPSPGRPADGRGPDRLRHPRARRRHLRRPLRDLPLAGFHRRQPARVPRPLRRHRRQHARSARSMGAHGRLDPRRDMAGLAHGGFTRRVPGGRRPADPDLPAHRRRVPRRALPDRSAHRRPVRARRPERPARLRRGPARPAARLGHVRLPRRPPRRC